MKPDLNSMRAAKARLAIKIGSTGYKIFVIFAVLLLVAAAVLLMTSGLGRSVYLLVAGGLGTVMLAAWYKRDLNLLPVNKNSIDERLSGEILGLLPKSGELTPKRAWEAIAKNWQTFFFANHLLIHPDQMAQLFSERPEDMLEVWEKSSQLADKNDMTAIEAGHVTAGLMLSSPAVNEWLKRTKSSSEDIVAMTAWLSRALKAMRAEKPYFGGIGRDWASGFTPALNRYGNNISLALERGNADFGWLTKSDGVKSIKGAFSQGAKMVVLIGEPGVGKTSHVYALAQNLLAERNDRNLEHRQIVSLDAAAITSEARRPGELEKLMVALIHETAHAGNIILFLDDARLFFDSGVGSFDASNLLQQAAHSGSVQIIMAMTPNDFQAIKQQNSSLTSLTTPVTLTEPDKSSVMGVLEDTALGLEHSRKVLIAYEALREAYRLSARYDQDLSYPGKAIRLLEQSIPHADRQLVTASAVQKAVEQAHGVKVSSAAPAEADTLLNLEDRIHERMINQDHAVKVVAAALRRSRAGVAAQDRPIGSFLFLGPTGVGKTELARSIAATYFGDQDNMIRLDMSEYQQSQDLDRLLSSGHGQSTSLIMSVRQKPFSVVLLDEIEKAHSSVLNLLLQMLDEGRLSDETGKPASFKDCIIIATSNAGAQTIREKVADNEQLESFREAFIDELISGNQFKPELINRFDELVLFRPLNQDELVQVVGLIMNEVNKTLASQNISVELTKEAAKKIVDEGNDPRLGARPMRRMVQRTVEDSLSSRILAGEVKPGDHVIFDVSDLGL